MQTRHIALLAALCCSPLAITLPVHAQMAMSASGSMTSPADVFTKQLKGEADEIVSAADAMPADKFNFAPTMGEFKGVRTFGDQCKHIAMANYHMLAGWNIPNGKTDADLKNLTSKADIVQALRDSFTYAQQGFATITAQNAFQANSKGGTRAGTAAYLMAHANDHYGQMVEYLRMNGIVPPASRGGM